METSLMLEKIKACDDEYLTLFCSKGREWGLFVYQDRQLPELPQHNFLLIPEHIPAGRLRGLADVARNTAKATGRSYLRIQLSQPLKFSNAISEDWGCYYLSDEGTFAAAPDPELSFSAVNDEEQAQAFRDFEAAMEAGDDLARRRAERLTRAYLAENGLTCWLCRREGKIVAWGELFVSGDAAKLGSLRTAPGEKQDETGSALLIHLIEQGRRQGARLIYGEAQTDMPGFTRIGGFYTVQWQFDASKDR